MTNTTILYLQLPLLDNDTKSERENFLFAGAYLDHALSLSDETQYHNSIFAPTEWDELDNQHLVKAIINSGADIIACTLYLWNIERTIRLAALLKAENPTLKIMVGGPETAKDHPLLFTQNHPFDAVIIGDGENIFPRLLNAWRTGSSIDFDNLVLNTSKGWKQGTTPTPPVDLAQAQPSEQIIMQCAENRPVTYLETIRGCPLTCSYCRYYHLHNQICMLSTEQVIHRIQQFRKLGAKEIRFVDPTFNARPKFTDFLKEIVKANPDHDLEFFAEIRSDSLTNEQAQLMKQANFTAVEVGVQSIDANVLKNVTRPVRLEKTGEGIQALCDAGVHVVLDIMYGLPEQTINDVKDSLNWGLQFGKSVQVQCMQTLILPGTVLREEIDKWEFIHENTPPYAIQQTSTLTSEHIQEIEILLDEHPDLPADPVTPRFCSQRLSGLFKSQHRISTNQLNAPLPGKNNRRALLIHGNNLFQHRSSIASLIQRAISTDPDGLWQFVLIPDTEEPLDLIEELAATIRKHPPHMLDLFASASAFEVTVSRRLFIRSNPNMSTDWKDAAEELLREHFG